MAIFVGHYITQRMAENRLSAAVVRRIYDDDNVGAVDDDSDSPLGQACRDAETWFEAVAIGIYPDLVALRAGGGDPAVSMVLDCFEAIAAKRFPRAVNRDWQALWDTADKQLMRMRRGEIKLPVTGTPNPPANVGGRVEVFGPEIVATDNEPTWNSGTGIF
jgi:hypothetical protein